MGCLGLMSLVWVALGVGWVVAPPAAMDPGVARGILEWGLLVGAVCAMGFFLRHQERRGWRGQDRGFRCLLLHVRFDSGH